MKQPNFTKEDENVDTNLQVPGVGSCLLGSRWTCEDLHFHCVPPVNRLAKLSANVCVCACEESVRLKERERNVECDR